MKRINYNRYINSIEWAVRRGEFLRYLHSINRAKCFNCKKKYKSGFHVHHLNYDTFGDEDLSCLSLLCEDCHNKIHGQKSSKMTKKQKIQKILNGKV